MIRNFCIIAHIDHGKSTLADRLLEATDTIESRKMKDQLLDQMDIEREKGITIKLQPVRMKYKDYELNLIDTPGHVDFAYEVSRSLEACEGAILVVDATQGIQAQTLTTVYAAIAADLHIVPVINKIDLPAADVEKVSKEIIELLGNVDIIKVSAKTGENIDKLLDAVIENIPAPKGEESSPLQALVFDSFYDEYRGVVLSVRVVNGILNKRANILMMASQAEGIASEVGFLNPSPQADNSLKAGEIGYIVTDFKTVSEAKVGDTVTLVDNPADKPLEGYEEPRPFVYAGLFPAQADQFPKLKEALDKLSLNDAALTLEPENSQVLGRGFRAGFLGLLHMEIVQERLQRHSNLDVIVTNPSTEYQVELTDGQEISIKSATELPDPSKIASIKEPWIKGEIVAPKQYVGAITQLVATTRGLHKHIKYIEDIAVMDFESPLANVLTDFYDQLKSISSGYGSLNYEIKDYRQDDLVRLDILVAEEVVEGFSRIVHRSEADSIGRSYLEKLKEVIPKQLFRISLQAAVHGRVIAREDISALKKNVTAHLYGGDVSRKKKLWAKQKKGKERLKQIGKVEIPTNAFISLLKKD